MNDDARDSAYWCDLCLCHHVVPSMVEWCRENR